MALQTVIEIESDNEVGARVEYGAALHHNTYATMRTHDGRGMGMMCKSADATMGFATLRRPRRIYHDAFVMVFFFAVEIVKSRSNQNETCHMPYLCHAACLSRLSI